jgi:TPR repeat protein
MNHIGIVYGIRKKQYDKALARYLLAARENDSTAYKNIGVLYNYGYGVPQNYLCALKWYLKAAEQCEYENTPNNIGKLFENGYGVPLDKYKALEWYCRRGDISHHDRLKNQGYHLSASDMGTLSYIADSLY